MVEVWRPLTVQATAPRGHILLQYLTVLPSASEMVRILPRVLVIAAGAASRLLVLLRLPFPPLDRRPIFVACRRVNGRS